MRRSRVCGAVVAVLLTAAVAGSAGGAGAARNAVTPTLKGANRPYLPGEVVVRFRRNAGPLSREKALSSESATTVKRLVVPGLQLAYASAAEEEPKA